jgi:hypothetical protein
MGRLALPFSKIKSPLNSKYLLPLHRTLSDL